MEYWVEGNTTCGRAAIGPVVWVPGTTLPRAAVLATMVDVVAGMRPDGPVSPTVDLRLQVLESRPVTSVRLSCEVLREGRTLFVAETRLYADSEEVPFARSIVTFLNRRMSLDGWESQVESAFELAHIDDLLDPQFTGPGIVEIEVHPRLINGPGATVQGGVQALLAELATEAALVPHGGFVVVDLDIRYLSKVKVGPVRAIAELLGSRDEQAVPSDTPSASVRITDEGSGGRLIAVATTNCRRLTSPSVR